VNISCGEVSDCYRLTPAVGDSLSGLRDPRGLFWLLSFEVFAADYLLTQRDILLLFVLAASSSSRMTGAFASGSRAIRTVVARRGRAYYTREARRRAQGAEPRARPNGLGPPAPRGPDDRLYTLEADAILWYFWDGGSCRPPRMRFCLFSLPRLPTSLTYNRAAANVGLRGAREPHTDNATSLTAAAGRESRRTRSRASTRRTVGMAADRTARIP